MGIAVLEASPPASRNAGQSASRGATLARHRRKRQAQGELATLMLGAGVPRPIPGDRVRATARILFPTDRRRDEGNYRDSLEKALGDALSPHDPDSPFRWLTDDTPEHFTFGAVTFGVTEWAPEFVHAGRTVRRRKPAVAIIRLVWGDDLATELERELEQLRDRAS